MQFYLLKKVYHTIQYSAVRKQEHREKYTVFYLEVPRLEYTYRQNNLQNGNFHLTSGSV